MKFVYGIVLIFVFTSACSKNKSQQPGQLPLAPVPEVAPPITADTNHDLDIDSDTPLSPTPVFQPEVLLISASRDYNPSHWNNYQGIASFDGIIKIPLTIDVTAGNSGTGWTTLQIQERKFCYQGVAMNNQTANGHLFVLKKEITNQQDSCHNSLSQIELIDRKVIINKGDQIILEVNGGGCSSVHGSCMYTEVSMEIIPELQ